MSSSRPCFLTEFWHKNELHAGVFLHKVPAYKLPCTCVLVLHAIPYARTADQICFLIFVLGNFGRHHRIVARHFQTTASHTRLTGSAFKSKQNHQAAMKQGWNIDHFFMFLFRQHRQKLPHCNPSLPSYGFPSAQTRSEIALQQ